MKIARTTLIRDAKEQGFTLVELLVVIIIIGILAAIAIPVFLNQRQRANEASLKQDMRNVAQVFSEWQVSPENTSARLRSLLENNSMTTWFIAPDQRVREITPLIESRQWNNLPGVTPLSISSGNLIELVIVSQEYANPNGWTRIHDEGEFCIIGRNANSKYNYAAIEGGTPGGNEYYTHILYYDSSLGGIMEIEDLAAARQNGEQVACYAYADRYLAALAALGG